MYKYKYVRLNHVGEIIASTWRISGIITDSGFYAAVGLSPGKQTSDYRLIARISTSVVSYDQPLHHLINLPATGLAAWWVHLAYLSFKTAIQCFCPSIKKLVGILDESYGHELRKGAKWDVSDMY